jgi:nucleotide-binding universal stress UspA family protein
MSMIFVAYGDPETREDVLEFATQRAQSCDSELFVYHVQEGVDENATDVQAEIEAVVDRTAPGVEYTVDINTVSPSSDHNNVSKQKRLLDAILESEPDFEYVVMGNVEHGMIESISIPSLTKSVLETREVPVLLVPV